MWFNTPDKEKMIYTFSLTLLLSLITGTGIKKVQMLIWWKSAKKVSWFKEIWESSELVKQYGGRGYTIKYQETVEDFEQDEILIYRN